jgi:hypothetical protein
MVRHSEGTRHGWYLIRYRVRASYYLQEKPYHITEVHFTGPKATVHDLTLPPKRASGRGTLYIFVLSLRPVTYHFNRRSSLSLSHPTACTGTLLRSDAHPPPSGGYIVALFGGGCGARSARDFRVGGRVERSGRRQGWAKRCQRSTAGKGYTSTGSASSLLAQP